MAIQRIAALFQESSRTAHIRKAAQGCGDYVDEHYNQQSRTAWYLEAGCEKANNARNKHRL